MGRKRLLMFYALLGFAMMQYQNCAPTTQNFDDPIETVGTEPVDVIDPIATGDISFQQSKVSAFANDELTVHGLCQDAGAYIGWKLLDLDGNVVERGLAECDLGAFEIQFTGKWKSFCDEDLILQAALGAKSKSQTIIETLCD